MIEYIIRLKLRSKTRNSYRVFERTIKAENILQATEKAAKINPKFEVVGIESKQ